MCLFKTNDRTPGSQCFFQLKFNTRNQYGLLYLKGPTINERDPITLTELDSGASQVRVMVKNLPPMQRT